MKLNGLKRELNVIVFNKYYQILFLLFCLSNGGHAIEPEDLLVSDALSKPCLSGSVQEADLMSCVSKGYILAQKKLNFNYKVSIQQENQKIREYLILSQKNGIYQNLSNVIPNLKMVRRGR